MTILQGPFVLHRHKGVDGRLILWIALAVFEGKGRFGEDVFCDDPIHGRAFLHFFFLFFLVLFFHFLFGRCVGFSGLVLDRLLLHRILFGRGLSFRLLHLFVHRCLRFFFHRRFHFLYFTHNGNGDLPIRFRMLGCRFIEDHLQAFPISRISTDGLITGEKLPFLGHFHLKRFRDFLVIRLIGCNRRSLQGPLDIHACNVLCPIVLYGFSLIGQIFDRLKEILCCSLCLRSR